MPMPRPRHLPLSALLLGVVSASPYIRMRRDDGSDGPCDSDDASDNAPTCAPSSGGGAPTPTKTKHASSTTTTTTTGTTTSTTSTNTSTSTGIPSGSIVGIVFAIFLTLAIAALLIRSWRRRQRARKEEQALAAAAAAATEKANSNSAFGPPVPPKPASNMRSLSGPRRLNEDGDEMSPSPLTPGYAGATRPRARTPTRDTTAVNGNNSPYAHEPYPSTTNAPLLYAPRLSSQTQPQYSLSYSYSAVDGEREGEDSDELGYMPMLPNPFGRTSPPLPPVLSLAPTHSAQLQGRGVSTIITDSFDPAPSPAPPPKPNANPVFYTSESTTSPTTLVFSDPTTSPTSHSNALSNSRPVAHSATLPTPRAHSRPHNITIPSRSHTDELPTPPSPSQWLSRSPTRGTSTLLGDMVGYQKQLEADAYAERAEGSAPPRYSVERP